MAEMEELHLAAKAYFSNACNGLQNQAREFFHSMDTNGDGRVSFNELRQFFFQNGYNRIDPSFLDRDRNGILDFYEVLTYFYIVKTRVVFCACCECYQMGQYFTCVTCFRNGCPYSLCPTCYEEWRLPHSHYDFMDNYAFLRFNAGLPPDVWCGCCGKYLTGLYFSCVDCFGNARSTGDTYDLCSRCYMEQRHQQQYPHHNCFLDSYVLLQVEAGLHPFPRAPEYQQALVPGRAPSTSQQRTRFQELETGVAVVNTAVGVVNMAAALSSAGCSIM